MVRISPRLPQLRFGVLHLDPRAPGAVAAKDAGGAGHEQVEMADAYIALQPGIDLFLRDHAQHARFADGDYYLTPFIKRGMGKEDPAVRIVKGSTAGEEVAHTNFPFRDDFARIRRDWVPEQLQRFYSKSDVAQLMVDRLLFRK